METSTDRIEKTLVLRAPRTRVWRALTKAEEFGTWFRAKLEGPFIVGQRVRARITHPGYEHLTMELAVEQMDAERTFSFRWHPHAIDPKVDYSSEPMTLVEFRLEDEADATKLTVVESGFDRVPAARRELAFRMNAEGWSAQLANVKAHVGG